MGSNSSGWFSNEEMLASIDPEKMHTMSVQKKIAAQVALNCSLTLAMYSRGRIRSKFKGISHSDCKNLFDHVYSASKFPTPVAFNPYLRDLIEELRSMLQESESSSKSITSQQTRDSNGIPVPIPCAEKITKGSYQNSGEQHLQGKINNQTGNVSGNGNGSYIVVRDCNFYQNSGEQQSQGLNNDRTRNVSDNGDGSYTIRID